MPNIVTRSGITPTTVPDKEIKASETVIAEDSAKIIHADFNNAESEEILQHTVTDDEGNVTPITEDQVHMIHEYATEVDHNSINKLNEASEATEAEEETAVLEERKFVADGPLETAHEELVPDAVDVYNEDDPLINPEEIHETEEDLKAAFKPYGISDDDAMVVIDIMREYKANGSAKGLYNKLPASMKLIVDGIIGSAPRNQLNAMRSNAVAMLLDNFLHDAKFNQAFEELEENMNDAVRTMNEEYNELFRKAIEETFDKIDEIRAENPEQADRIEKVKRAFDDADTLAKEKELLTHMSAKKLNKLRGRFSGEAFSLNKRVSNTSMKLPKIEDLFTPIRHQFLDDEFSDDDIMKLLTLICRAHMNSDFTNDLAELAYIYKLLSSIYSYTFMDLTTELDATGTKIFTNIREVLESIKSL